MKPQYYVISFVLVACSILARSFKFQSPLGLAIEDYTNCNNNNNNNPSSKITEELKLIVNPIVGGSGGHAFQALAPLNESVSGIELHCGYGTGDSKTVYVIRGIRLNYTDGSSS